MNEKDIEIINNLHYELEQNIDNGKGPFLAAIYDEGGNLLSKAQNSVIKDNCSMCHAEVNAIMQAQKELRTYDLSPYNATIYVTAEPCMMCLGAILWSGIKRICFSVSSETVEKITGFDEGYKPDWINQFKKRGIAVRPYVLSKAGERVLNLYMKKNGTIYSPNRD